MVVANYQIRDKNQGNYDKSVQSYKFKTCYAFLSRYYLDGFPFTIERNTRFSGELHCRSNKLRSFNDLAALAFEHVKRKNYSKKKFKKAFVKFLYNFRISWQWCPYVSNIVFGPFNKTFSSYEVYKEGGNYQVKLQSITNISMPELNWYKNRVQKLLFSKFLKFSKLNRDKAGFLVAITKLKIK